MAKLCGLEKFPDGIPPILVISIATNGYTEAETRQIIEEGGDAARADEWIQKLRAAGLFHDTGPDASIPHEKLRHRTISKASNSTKGVEDGGKLLWDTLMNELTQDEVGFKHQVVVLDNVAKQYGLYAQINLCDLAKHNAETFCPASQVSKTNPWHGCKFVAMAVMHLLSKADTASKREAVTPVSRSLGG